jgi:hypothetical protein
VAIRECSYLGVPAVNIGSRQQGRERGANVIDVEHDRARHRARRLPSTCAAARRRAITLRRRRAGARIADCLATTALTVEKRLTLLMRDHHSRPSGKRAHRRPRLRLRARSRASASTRATLCTARGS